MPRSSKHEEPFESAHRERAFTIHTFFHHAILKLAALVTPEKPGAPVEVRFDDVELVDAFLCDNRELVLIRTGHPRVLATHQPNCSVNVTASGASRSCPSWAWPHSERRDQSVIAVSGAPTSMGETTEEWATLSAASIASESVYINVQPDVGDRAKAGGGFRWAGHGQALVDPTWESAECDGMRWVKVTARAQSGQKLFPHDFDRPARK
jgi:hypothetical protein